MNKKSAFTLAEVLITLVIIGVVAVITLPSVFAEYREAERSGRVKKCYSTLANAMTVAKSLGSDMDFAVVYQDGGLVPAYNGAAEAKIVSDCTKRGTCLSYVLKYLDQ